MSGKDKSRHADSPPAGSYSVGDRRNDPRFVVNLPAHVTIRGERVFCQLVDISEHGALVQTAGPVHVGDKVSLDLPNIGPTIAMWVGVMRSTVAIVGPMFGRSSETLSPT